MAGELKRLTGAVAALMFCSSASAETPAEIALLFGRADAMGNPQLSPDGSRLAVECSPAVHLTICVFDLIGGAEPVIVPRMADVRLTDHYWANGKTLILDIEAFERLQTSNGLEEYTFERAVAFNIEDQKPVLLLSDNRAWVDTNNLAAIGTSENEKLLFSIISESSTQMGFDTRMKSDDQLVFNLMEVDLSSGRSKIKTKATQNVVDAVVTPDGKIVAEIRYRDKGSIGHELEIVAGGKTLFQRSKLKQYPLTIWGLDISGKNLIVFLEEGETEELFLMSLADGTLTPIEDRGGLVGPVIDKRKRHVVGFEYPDDFTEQSLVDEELKRQIADVSSVFPGSSVTVESWSDDRSMTIMKIERSGKPADYYLFEPAAGSISPIGSVAPHLEDRPLGIIEPITYPAQDGLEITGYLTLPPGKTRGDGPFPLIVMPHGGPEARDTLEFNWWAQAYAAAGYSVLQPNYRGSAGFGSKFRDAGYGEFGDKMVTDVLDGVRWAVKAGLAEEGKVCAAGASYGGYSALMLGALGQNEVRCVISVNGITTPSSLLGDVGKDSFVYNYLVRYLGIDRFADAASRSDISPVRRVDDIRAPVLLIAGREDSVVPYSQAEAFMAAARHRSDVTLVTMESEDHYLSTTFARHKVLDESLAFLALHLPVP